MCGAIYNSVSLSKREQNQMIEVHDFKSARKKWREEEEYDPIFDKPDPSKKTVWDSYLEGIGMM